MAYRFARFLQIVGLILLPLAVAGNLAELARVENALSLRDSMILAAIGGLCFYAGYVLQGKLQS